MRTIILVSSCLFLIGAIFIDQSYAYAIEDSESMEMNRKSDAEFDMEVREDSAQESEQDMEAREDFAQESEQDMEAREDSAQESEEDMEARSLYNKNLVVNGNAETGKCEPAGGVTPPTGWQHTGKVTQMSYGAPSSFGSINPKAPGPSDRGKCYFTGHNDATNSMWQVIKIEHKSEKQSIDDGSTTYKLSAWIGGWEGHDDNARVILTFLDADGKAVGKAVQLGPVLAGERGRKTALLHKSASGDVPAKTRSMKVTVVFTRAAGLRDDGSIDDISLVLEGCES